jgi:hypothetical protein
MGLIIHVKLPLKEVSEDIRLQIEKELTNYCKVLHAKYGIHCEIKIGPFYSTVEEVEE